MSLEQSLTVCLVQASTRVVCVACHQELLLFCEVSSLSVKGASDESSSTPWYFHKILRKFLVLNLCGSFFLADNLVNGISVLLSRLLTALVLDGLVLLSSCIRC